MRYYEYCCTTPITDGGGNFYLAGNLYADPLYVDAAGGDYRLTRASPCRNTGLNLDWMIGAKDLDGKPRRDAGAGAVDIGAYEYQTPGTLLLVR